jgi:hypothetical protein
VTRVAIALLVGFARPTLAQQDTKSADAADTIAGKPYVKLATRAQTEQAMRAQFAGGGVEWGPWQWLGPFPLAGGSKTIATPFPFELELVKSRNASASRGAASSVPATLPSPKWFGLDGSNGQGGADGSLAIDLAAVARAAAVASGSPLAPDAKLDHVVGYLRRTVTAREPTKLHVKVGSDDGLRLWLNGVLVVDAPVERGFDPDQHDVELALARGSNELVAKVAQDAGGWQFELAPRTVVDRAAEAALEWRLECDFPDGESRHWRLATVAVPESAALEVGGVDLLADGRPVVCTRHGDVWIVDGAYDTPSIAPKVALFASGLHESLGVAVRPDARAKEGWCAMVAQRGELTRLVDVDGDGRADLYETVCDAWQISGNYHEYAFGPRFDDAGNAWVTLNLGHVDRETVMGTLVPTRGCAVRIAPDGAMEVVADGLRSPDALNLLPGVGMAYTDNQGDYVATNKLSPLTVGSFHGHQSTLPMRAFEPLAHGHDGFAVTSWKKGDALPTRTPAAVWFPYGKMGQSASDFVVDTSGGKFGPFAGQLFVGDQTHATVMRVALESVVGADGVSVLQGACFPFLAGFRSGVHRLCFAKDGSLFVGLTDRGWGSRGSWRDGLERVLYTGVEPFEVRSIHVVPDGFDVEFTADVDPASVASSAGAAPSRSPIHVKSWTYEYHPAYGCAELESADHAIVAVELRDARRLHLQLDRLRVGFVHELDLAGVRSARGESLLHSLAWYTLNVVPPSSGTPGVPRKK